MTVNIELWKYAQQSYNGRKINLFYETSKSREFRKILGHSKETFKGKLDLVYFLDNNPEVSIYLTAGDEALVFEDLNGRFLIGLEAFYNFQSRIRGSKGQKVDAFLKQKSNLYNSSFTLEEKDNFIIQHGTEENIIEIVRKLPEEKQAILLQSLQIEFGKGGSFNLESNAEGVFLLIGNIDNREIVIEQLKKLEKNNFKNIENALSISKIDKILDAWEKNKENDDESFWQKLFENEEYTWVFQQLFPYPILFLQGETYVGGKNSKGRNGQGGVATDFIYKNLSSNSFALIEIKTPKTLLMEKEVYRGKKGTDNTNEIYPPNRSLSGSLIQLQNQIQTGIEDFLTTLGRDFLHEELNHLHSHGILLIGKIDPLTNTQKESFILFRRTIKDITIVTFDELFEKIKSLKQIYE